MTTPALPGTPVLRTSDLSKDYGENRVVSDLSVVLHAGSIHALLGENGAGKSTLIKMLAGSTPRSAGEIFVDGVVQDVRSVRDAQRLGVIALPQELTLVPTLGAAENVFLGMRRGGALVNRRALGRDAAAALERLGQQLPLNVPVRELSAVQQTMVALARALVRNARVLILDEPTAALTDTETEQLFGVLRRLRDEGTSILYVSHRLDEVFALADTATVMRGGRLVWTKPIAEIDTDLVVTAMIGREHGQVYPPRAGSATPHHGSAARLSVTGLSGYKLRDVTLSAHAGRVLGVAGLAGSGRSELLRLISGAERPQAGAVVLDRADVTRLSVGRSMAAGIAYVPEERRSEGLVLQDSIMSNISLANFGSLSSFGVMRRRREVATAERGVRNLRVATTSVYQPVEELSGGNQQKVVLAKYLENAPRVLLLDEPTRGIDVGTKSEIYQVIRQLAQSGVAVIVVSSELPELIGLADEIAVLREGRLTGVVAAAESTESSILHLCYRSIA